MKCNYVKVEVEKEVNMIHVTSVFPHEIPVLMSVYGEGNVRIDESGPVEDMVDGKMQPVTRDIQPAKEYERLGRKYGVDASGASHVANVYGQAFTKQLDGAMKQNLELVGMAKPKSKAKRSAKPASGAANAPTSKPEDAEDPLG